jgi:hypothetical protein
MLEGETENSRFVEVLNGRDLVEIAKRDLVRLGRPVSDFEIVLWIRNQCFECKPGLFVTREIYEKWK